MWKWKRFCWCLPIVLMFSGPVHPQTTGNAGTDPRAMAVSSRADNLQTEYMRMRLKRLPYGAFFDTGVTTLDTEEKAGRQDFWQLFGLLVSPDSYTDEDGGKFKFEVSPTKHFKIMATASKPVLRDGVEPALGPTASAEALSGLDFFDDVLYEASLDTRPKPDGEIYQLLEVPFRDARKEVMDRMGSVQNGFQQQEEDILRSGRDPVDVPDLQARALLDETWRSLGDLPRLYWMAIRNRMHAIVTVRHRDVNQLIGQAETGASFSLAWGTPSLPGSGEKRGAKLLSLAARAKKGRQGDESPHSFALQASFKELKAVEVPSNPALNLEAFKELSAAFNWTTKLAREQLQVDGEPVGMDQSFTARYVRPNEDFANERLVVNDTITFWLSRTLALPISITYANRAELIDEREVIGHVGFTYSFRNSKETRP